MTQPVTQTHPRIYAYNKVACVKDERARGPLPSLTPETATWSTMANLVVGLNINGELHQFDPDLIEVLMGDRDEFAPTMEARGLALATHLTIEEDRRLDLDRRLSTRLRTGNDLDEVSSSDVADPRLCLRPAPDHLRQLYDTLEADDVGDLEALRLREELLARLRMEFEALPEPEREVVRLRVLEGLGFKEAGRVVSRPTSTTWDVYRRAIERLASALAFRVRG
jgi:DNA-directed RNA polymerase specialized sigma24 family protein